MDERTSRAPGQSDAKSFSPTTIYGKACELDAVADLEDQKVAKLTEQTLPSQIESPDQLSSEASIFNLELQPNAPLRFVFQMPVQALHHLLVEFASARLRKRL